MASEKNIEIVAAGHTCLDLIPAFTIEGKVDKMTDVLVPGKMINMGKCVVVSFQDVPVAQKRIMAKANAAGRPFFSILSRAQAGCKSAIIRPPRISSMPHPNSRRPARFR